MKNYTIKDITHIIKVPFTTVGNENYQSFSNAKAINDADENSIVWVNPTRKDKFDLIKNTAARIIICSDNLQLDDQFLSEKNFIQVKEPKLVYLRIVEAFFVPKIKFGIHPTAYISPEAEIHPNTYIGPFTYIGKSKIGANSIIYGHCYIYDNVTIGNNVIINAGSVLGADGFGYSKNENGEMEKFPHIGSVIVEDYVEIGANTCIDKGTLGATILKEGSKIDNLVHIAHNVVVGKHAAVIALAMIGGSTKIGDFSWISPASSLRDAIEVGNNSLVGMGAVVTKDIPANETWTGSPAKPLRDFIEIQNKLKKL